MKTSVEIKKSILNTCPQIEDLLNEFEKAIHLENNDNAYELLKKSLTFAEDDALDEIIDKIGREGIISINSLSRETGISRPVFNNLLNKLENTKVANIQNMGAKGTYIKIINQKLIKERG